MNARMEATLDENLQTLAFLAKSLSDENCLRILLCVSNGKKSVSRIVEELPVSATCFPPFKRAEDGPVG